MTRASKKRAGAKRTAARAADARRSKRMAKHELDACPGDPDLHHHIRAAVTQFIAALANNGCTGAIALVAKYPCGGHADQPHEVHDVQFTSPPGAEHKQVAGQWLQELSACVLHAEAALTTAGPVRRGVPQAQPDPLFVQTDKPGAPN